MNLLTALSNNGKVQPLTVYVDGSLRNLSDAGAAAIALAPGGYFLGWLSRKLPRMTNNEAEYNAVLLGLELAHCLARQTVEIRSDSEVVVRQVMGLSRVNSSRLKPLHRQTCARIAHFEQVRLHHVPREQNMMADALATLAAAGQLVRMP